MPKKAKNPKKIKKKTYSIAEAYGYTHKDFKQWGKLGGRTKLYENTAERMRAYRLRKKLKEGDGKAFSLLYKKLIKE